MQESSRNLAGQAALGFTTEIALWFGDDFVGQPDWA